VFRRPGQRRLETFYRAARRSTGLLMEGEEPAAGRWNFDEDNRQTWKGKPSVPPRPHFAVDAVTREVIDLVVARYPAGFGSVDAFNWPVTAHDVARAADHFFDHLLAHFGPFEDAIAIGEPALFHSLLSASINLGMLDPLALCRRAAQAWRDGAVPLASAEGFIRQILGWREFVRHVFEEHAQAYFSMNALEAGLALPDWYWGEPSGMHCIDDTVQTVLRTGHSHHITRLMVLSNLATLLGVDPQALNDWFWFAYVDAYDWVVTPNVVGMGTFADGGIFATKPYIASGRYIRKMGPSLCAACRYDSARSDGPTACPFNHLYWDFLERNGKAFADNPRMTMPLRGLARLDTGTRADHHREAQAWRARAAAAEYGDGSSARATGAGAHGQRSSTTTAGARKIEPGE
jgi:deoxyribodipyrimidine photolyase-related protein